MLAEDDSALREFLCEVLMGADCKVDTAEDGVIARKYLDENSYELLVTDFNMPRMNGFELSLAAQEHFPKMKIIMLSGGGNIQTNSEKDAVRIGNREIKINAFLDKPVHVGDFCGVIRKVLAN